jgi:hypothetical protein
MRYKLMRLLPVVLCVQLWAGPAWAGAGMSELNYRDADPGSAAYRTRILVTPGYLRMDTGDDNGDFALLDRASGELLNVIRSEQRAYRYETRKVDIDKPQPWQVTQTVKQLAATTRQFTWSVNGKVCGQVTAAATLLPDTAKALQQYWQALASSQVLTWQRTPVELRNECDLARYVLEIPRLFQYGLPLEDIASDGHSRRYESNRIVPLRADLFTVPKTYQTVNSTN